MMQLPPEHDVHLANDDEIQTVADILGSAFTHDPMMNWMCEEPSIYSGCFRYEIEALYKQYQHIYINKDKTGAAVWLPSGIATALPWHWRLLPVALQLLRYGGLKGLVRSIQFEKLADQWRIEEAHFYLHTVGASFGNQGRGVGSALLKAGLQACDEAGMPAYLESTNEKNNMLYQRFGFEVIGQQHLPGAGPMIWFMRRPRR